MRNAARGGRDARVCPVRTWKDYLPFYGSLRLARILSASYWFDFNQCPAVTAFRGGPEWTHRIPFYSVRFFWLLSTFFSSFFQIQVMVVILLGTSTSKPLFSRKMKAVRFEQDLILFEWAILFNAFFIKTLF